MAIRVFFDTNILLDLLDDKRPFHQESSQLFSLAETRKLDVYISETILATTDYIFQKIAEKKKRNSILSDLLDSIAILPCTTKICKQALLSNHQDLEDVILYCIALEHEIEFFITNDKLLKKITGPVPIVSSKELLNISH